MALADLKKRNAAKLEAKRIEELTAAGKYAGPPKLQGSILQNSVSAENFSEPSL
jgi:hypothetical protein